MLYSYQELEEMKKNGIVLNWEEISKEQLEKLFIEGHVPNGLIADLYGVSKDQVRSKRRKWNISQKSAKYIYARYTEENSSLFAMLNDSSRERLWQEENIDFIAKALTHYVFRNGPVENMHSMGKLEESDMKTLNKYMVNKIAGLLKLAMDGEWLKIELLCNALRYFGTDWDSIEIDTKEIDMIFNNRMGFEEEENL